MDFVRNLIARAQRNWRAVLAIAVILVGGSQAFACYQRENQPSYIVTELTPASPFHGVTGLAIGPDGQLYAAAPNGVAILKVRPSDGRVTSAGIDAPDGADGLAMRADGAMAWTNMQSGAVYFRDPAGATLQIGADLRGVRSAAFGPDAMLYAAQIGDVDALWRLDPTGAAPPAKVAENLGGLRGFTFGPDGKIYGALSTQRVLAKIDPQTGEVMQTISGYDKPTAAAFAPDGMLYAVDGAEGVIEKVDFAQGSAVRIARLRDGVDDVVIDAQNIAYVSLPANDTILRVDLNTRTSRELVKGQLGAPSDLGIIANADGAALAVADNFAMREIEMNSGVISDWLRMHSADIRRPAGIGIGAKYILLANPSSGSVTVIDRVKRKTAAQLGGYSMPLDALETEDGRFAILDSSVGELSLASAPDGAERRTIVRGLKAPVAMVSDGMGGFLVTESGAGRIVRIDAATGELSVIAEEINIPQGIDIAPDGRLVVAEAGEGRVIALDSINDKREVLAENLNIVPLKPNGPPSLFAGVAVAEDGSVFVSSSRSNVLYKLTPPR
jgi:sugar lactone lactonase YvrE